MEFYDRYAALCKEKDLNPQSREMFAVTGVTTGTISGWKRGSEPRPSVLVNIARYFDVSVDYLVGLSNVRNNMLSRHEQLLIDAFRAADEEGQQEIICTCRNEMHRAKDRSG